MIIILIVFLLFSLKVILMSMPYWDFDSWVFVFTLASILIVLRRIRKKSKVLFEEGDDL